MLKIRDNLLPVNKDSRVALNKIYGISWSHTNYLIFNLGIGSPWAIKNLNSYYCSIIKKIVNLWLWTRIKINDLIKRNIQNIIDIITYKGVRHLESLSVHGQRTRTNANTQRRKKLIIVDEKALELHKENEKINKLKKK